MKKNFRNQGLYTLLQALESQTKGSDEIMNNIAQLPVIFWSDEGDSLIASNTVNFNTPKDEIVKQMNNMVYFLIDIHASRDNT